MNFRALIIGTFLFLLGQTLVWYQINGQFISTWIKERLYSNVITWDSY